MTNILIIVNSNLRADIAKSVEAITAKYIKNDEY